MDYFTSHYRTNTYRSKHTFTMAKKQKKKKTITTSNAISNNNSNGNSNSLGQAGPQLGSVSVSGGSSGSNNAAMPAENYIKTLKKKTKGN